MQCLVPAGGETGLWSLPDAIVHQILGLAAFPLGNWMDDRPTRPVQFFDKNDQLDANFKARLEARKSAHEPWDPDDFNTVVVHNVL